MKINKIIFCFLCCISYELYSIVIVLNGTSSAGKSTIAKELYEMLGHGYELFQYDTYQPQKNFCQDIRKKAQQGKNIIVDSVILSFNSITLQYLEGLDICFVLVYAPLSTLIQHIYQRNLLADIKEKRTVYSVYMHYFLMMYQGVVNKQDQIDSISWDEFEKNSNHIDDQNNRNEVLESFKKKYWHDDQICYQAMYEYDLIVNTSILNGKQCAEQIIAYVQSNQKRSAFQKNYMKHNKHRKK